MNKYLDLSGLSYFWDKIKNYAVKRITSTDNAVVRFDGTNGNVQNSDITIDDNNIITTPGDIILKNSSNGAATPKIEFRRGSNTDTYNDWHINTNSSGNLIVGLKASSAATTKATLTSSGVTFANALEASSIKKTGGTSSQFLKADGSVDSNTYINTSSTAQTKSGNLTANKFITSGGTSDEFVKGDGSLSDKLYPKNIEWPASGQWHVGLKSLETLFKDSGVNVFAYINPDYMDVEYTNDGGTTWLDYQATNAQKIAFCTKEDSLLIGKKGSNVEKTNNDKVRITFHVGCGVYCHAQMLIFRGFFSGSCSITIEQTTYADQNTFTEYGTYSPIGDNPGYVVIPFDRFLFGNNQVHDLRITLSYIGNTYPNNNKSLSCIRVYSSNTYSANSTMAKTNHLYDYDTNRNMILPNCILPTFNGVADLGSSSYKWKNVYAKSFIKSGGTSSQFLKADGSVDSNNYAGSQSAGGPANKTVSIPFGQVDSTSAATAFTATVDGITELRDGICVCLQNGVINSASGYTININNLGAKPVYNSKSGNASVDAFTNGSSYLFVYNSTRISGGCWDMVTGYFESDTDYRAYQIRTNSQSLPASATIRSRRLLFTSADGSKYVPANTTGSTTTTYPKIPTTTKINPFGAILYYNSTSNTHPGVTPSSTILYQQINIQLGYSFNWSTGQGDSLTLTDNAPVYLKCIPQADGSAKIATNADIPIVQSLPTTDDGKIYIFLGNATSATTIELMLNHPVYYYKNGAIRLWTGPV